MTDIGVAKKQSDIERHIKEQKHRRENIGITLYIYNQHSEGARNTQWGKDRLFKKNGVGKTANPQSEDCITVSSYTIHKTKLDFKWIIDLKETPKTVKI